MTTGAKAMLFHTSHDDAAMKRSSSALTDLGTKVVNVIIPDLRASERNIKEILKQERPDFLLCQNFYAIDPVQAFGDELENAISELDIPLFCWVADNPTCIGSRAWFWQIHSDRSFPSQLHCLTLDTEHENFLRSKQIKTTPFLWAVDREIGRLEVAALPTLPKSSLSFVGGTVDIPKEINGQKLNVELGFAIRGWHKNLGLVQDHPQFSSSAEICQEIQDCFEERIPYYIKFFRGEYLNSSSYRQAVDELDRGISQGMPTSLKSIVRDSLDGLAYNYGAKSLAFALRQLRGIGMEVFGNAHWTEQLEYHSANHRRLTTEEMLFVFKTSTINFCFTKPTFSTAVHERVLQVLAVGAFPLTDKRKGLDDYFGSALLPTYKNLQEAQELIAQILNDPGSVSTMVKRGQEIVLSKHTFHHRMSEILRLANKNNFLGEKRHEEATPSA